MPRVRRNVPADAPEVECVTAFMYYQVSGWVPALLGVHVEGRRLGVEERWVEGRSSTQVKLITRKTIKVWRKVEKGKAVAQT